MTKEKFKNIVKFSIILGAILGVLSLIPYICVPSIIIMSAFASVLVVVYMEKKQLIGELTIKGASILGGIIGFINLIGFLVIYLPSATILGAIFDAIFPDNIYFAGTKFLISIWWLLVLMGGLIVALFNSFSLLSYIYVRDTFFMLDGKKEIKPKNEKKD